MTTATQKQILLDNISNLAYILASAKMHNEKEGANRWRAKLDEACTITKMLELATDREINEVITAGTNEAADDYERSLTNQ